MIIRRLSSFALAFALALSNGCGASDDPAASGRCQTRDDCQRGEVCGADGACVPESTLEPEECAEPIAVPWLAEGNFWQVAWSEIDYQIGLFEAGGDYDVGSYSMKLGPPATVKDIKMFPLELNGDTQKHAPLWKSVGTDSCEDPTPLRIPGDERIFTMYGEINKYDQPAGSIPGVCAAMSDEVYAQVRSWYTFDQLEGQRIAEQVHDWYSFEITDPNHRIEFYLLWNDPDINLDFYWFAAPDDPTYGFLYFGPDYLDIEDAFPEFEHKKGIPNPTAAGKYLLGVRRTTPSDIATIYGIMVLK